MKSRELLAIANKIDTMRKLEKQVRRLNVIDCNERLTPGQDNRRMLLEEEYAELAKSFGLFAEAYDGASVVYEPNYMEAE